MEFIAKVRGQLTEFFTKMEKKQIIRLIVVAVLIIAVIVTVALLLNRKDYAVLYSDLESGEQGEIYTRLKSEGADVKSSGTSILLPINQVEGWRMQLASEGYPKTGFNYDIYAQGSSFGSTDATQEQYRIYQLQEDIRTTLKAMDKIKEAWVTVVLTRQSGYALALNQTPSSVGINIQLMDPTTPLTDLEAYAIREVVVTSVDGLSRENINIVDTQMRTYGLYDPNAAAEDDLEADPERYRLTEQVQEAFNKSVQELLSPVFGTVSVQTAVTLNFDKHTTQSIIFEPPVDGMETGLPISLKELTENIYNAAAAQGEPGLDENGGAPSYVETYQAGDNIYQKISRETNMEVNEIKTLIDRAKGSIEELSISVIIPLDEAMDDYTADVQELVGTAVGTPLTNVTVKRMPMIIPDPDALAAEAEAQAEAYRQAEMIRWIIIMAGIIIVVVLLLIALRTVLKALRPEPEPVPEMEEGALLDMMVDGEMDFMDEPAEDSPLMQIQGFIEKDPESVAQLLRNWLSDEY